MRNETLTPLIVVVLELGLAAGVAEGIGESFEKTVLRYYFQVPEGSRISSGWPSRTYLR